MMIRYLAAAVLGATAAVVIQCATWLGHVQAHQSAGARASQRDQVYVIRDHRRPRPARRQDAIDGFGSNHRLVSIRRCALDGVETSDIARGARLLPALRHGRPRGLKIYAIRPGGIFSLLGLQNGDTVLALNGLEVAAAAGNVHRAWSEFLATGALEIEGFRRGIPLMLHVRLIGDGEDCVDAYSNSGGGGL